jgi:hypothetical protein
MKVYSLSGITLSREYLPDAARGRQTTIFVRARTKVEALAVMSEAIGYNHGAKLGAADWRHSGQIDIPKFAAVARREPDGTVFYEYGWGTGDYRVLRAAGDQTGDTP